MFAKEQMKTRTVVLIGISLVDIISNPMSRERKEICRKLNLRIKIRHRHSYRRSFHFWLTIKHHSIVSFPPLPRSRQRL